MAEIDFEAEGLLDGLEGPARDGRRRLLEELADRGVPLDELKRAVAEDRLVLLPVEHVLRGDQRGYTAVEVAEKAGIDLDRLKRQWRALGMALVDDDEPVYGDQDVEAAKRIAVLREAGLPDEGILEVARLLGMTMSQLAAANRRLFLEAFVRESDTEYEIAKRFENAAAAFSPLISETLGYVLNLHLVEQIRHDALGGADLAAGRGAAAQEVTVAFADLVNFTRLGETLPPDQLGAVTGRLGELAADVVEPPVRLVKLIGDAAMLAGPEPGPVLDAALALVETASKEGEDFPSLRAGVATGQAIQRGGDWYGHPVNLASRLTAVAYPDSVLADEQLHDALADEYNWSFAGRRRLKGIDRSVKLYRARQKSREEE
ncbi:MAG: adenylate cyclase regulatory domain-containing protein [Solirubrobacterales bacterium]